MQLSAIILARVLGYIETFDLNPRGKVFYPEFVNEVVQRYKFQKFPKTIEEFDESKGIEFYEGKSGNKVIQKVVIFNTLLVVETPSSTSDSKQILDEMLTWAAAKFGLEYGPGTIKRFAYVSDLTFYSDIPLLSVNPALTKLAEKTGAAVTEIWQELVHYEPISFMVGHDPSMRKNPIAAFSIQRRAEARFSEK